MPSRFAPTFRPPPFLPLLLRADVFFIADLRREDFLAADFLPPDFLLGDFFAADFLRLDCFAADFLRLDFFAADFLRTDFLPPALPRDADLRIDLRAVDLRRVDFFAALRFRPALRADFFRPPFLAAIGTSPGFKDHFPATARSPRIVASLFLKRDANAASESAIAASALSSRLAGA